jgi:hypothetical protein
MELVRNPEKYGNAARTAGAYVHENTGATDIIIDYLTRVF